jgi:hypothetical protein
MEPFAPRLFQLTKRRRNPGMIAHLYRFDGRTEQPRRRAARAGVVEQDERRFGGNQAGHPRSMPRPDGFRQLQARARNAMSAA